MTEQAVKRPLRNLTAAGGIKAILLLQICIAVFLFSSDIARVLPRLGGTTPDAPRLTQPIEPGDQRRLYDRKHAPSGPAAPDTGDMPSRMVFEMDGDVLRMTGSIAENDAERFNDWLATREIPEKVSLHSTGGSVLDALAIGARLRDAETATQIEAGLVCLSACPYILASGVTRQVHAQAYVGVHQHSYGENTVLPAFLAIEDIQRGQGKVMVYLDEMGIDLRVMQHALATPPQEIYILTTEELETYALATEIVE